ncbi:MAG: glycosyltransferase, partial [Cyclobacteriaceae bacterium]|nr:glycosyltransferase [Cyclobacteriaceae bacterium]
MNITFIHQHFTTPQSGGALRSYYLATGLQKLGHSITVITTHNHPKKIIEITEGVTVIYLPIKYHNHYGFLKRVYSFLVFVRKAFSVLKSLEKPDLLYSISTPLTTGLIAIKAKRVLGIPYCFEVGDLWPE